MKLTYQPLAERMRPDSLDSFIGQTHLVNSDKVLKKVLDSGFCPSMIFWGPPGVGKTTLAMLIAHHLKKPFYTLSAVDSGVKQVREVIGSAGRRGGALLFIDEIHRFSKSQQDSLLGAVEKGIITLIGATTENPSFEVIPALLSRCQVYVLEALNKDELLLLLNNALYNDVVLRTKRIKLVETDELLVLSGGDARRLLNNFELLIEQLSAKEPHKEEKEIEITNAIVADFAQQQMLRYDKQGEQHYDLSSAFIKSMRGSDPNAAVYWLVRMLESGEDPKFIARRMLILAAEDIGNANPTALVLADTCFNAVNKIGYPECALHLTQTVIYLASCTKSNAAYTALNKAKKMVKKTGNLPVPKHLRNAPTQLMKDLNYSEGYLYSHDFPQNFITQEYMPDELSGQKIYDPANNQREETMRKRLKMLWKTKYKY